MTRPGLLDPAAVDAALGDADSPWRRDGDRIVVEFTFGSFLTAVAFVTDVAPIAERLNHHPDIDVRYTKVRLEVWTHDAGGLTSLDLELAAATSAAAAARLS